jgi:hypothetical protein
VSIDDSEQSRSEGAERGLDLSSLLQGLSGAGGSQEPGSPDLSGLGGLVSGLLGQGRPEAEPAVQPVSDAAGLAEGMGISPSAAQAALALVMGSLLRGGSAEGSQGGGLAGQLAQLGDQPLDEEAVKATGLPEQLSRNTGLDLPKAVQTVQQILDMLRKVTKPLGAAGASTTATGKKRRRKTTSSQSTTTARKKPKMASSSTRPKPKTTAKPKKGSSSTRPKPKTTAKPKKASTSKTAAKPKPAK